MAVRTCAIRWSCILHLPIAPNVLILAPPAVFAVFAKNFQRRAVPSPQKSSALAAAAKVSATVDTGSSWFFELLTKEIELDPKNLYVTVFGGDPETGIPQDEDSIKI